MNTKRATLLGLALAFAVMLGVGMENAMAQYTKEFIICTNGSSADACRATEIPPNDDGVVVWGRNYGSTLCVGVGFEPQDTECTFRGASYNGFDCQRFQNPGFVARVPAGGDMAVACGDISPLPNGNYSAKATSNTCFEDEGLCGNFLLTNVAP